MKIMAIGAHLDDIELACGGTLAKAKKHGHHVKAVIMSKSGYTNIHGEMQRFDEDAVREGTEALKILGVMDISIHDFPTKDIEFCSVTVEAIEKEIIDFRPDYILTHHPFDTHQAHVGVAKATVAAARRHNNVLFYEPIAPSGRGYVPFRPNYYIDITGEIEQKLDSLRRHKTEFRKFGGEDWVFGVQCRSGFRGYEIGVKYAECFEILRLAPAIL